jgi:hypothetical protein
MSPTGGAKCSAAQQSYTEQHGGYDNMLAHHISLGIGDRQGRVRRQVRRKGSVANAAPVQPIFYPVLNRDHAIKIAWDWNLPRHRADFVAEFGIDAEFLDRHDVHLKGAKSLRRDSSA